jgi:hypothetical protein
MNRTKIGASESKTSVVMHQVPSLMRRVAKVLVDLVGTREQDEGFKAGDVFEDIEQNNSGGVSTF